MLGQLSGIERLSAARFARDGDLEGLETALLAELFLHTLDVGSKTILAVPLESTVLICSFWIFSVLSGSTVLVWHEDAGGLGLDVEHDELLPVLMQVERSLLRVHGQVLKGNVTRLNQSCADAVRDGLDQFALSWTLRVVDAEDVLLLGGRLEDFFNHASQVFHVDRWDEVLTLSNYGKLKWILFPSHLEVMVENGLTKSIENTCRDNVLSLIHI